MQQEGKLDQYKSMIFYFICRVENLFDEINIMQADLEKVKSCCKSNLQRDNQDFIF